jgi:hypothetical protein
VEVNDFNNPTLLGKRLEEFFPKTIVRLIINGKYSPFFYLGSGLWIYNQFKKILDINFKICFEEKIEEIFNDEILDFLKFFNIDFKKLKIVRNLIFKNEEFCGCFFSDGTNHIFDQFIIDNTDKIKINFEKYLKAETIIDLTNIDNNGFLILKTKHNIFQ